MISPREGFYPKNYFFVRRSPKIILVCKCNMWKFDYPSCNIFGSEKAYDVITRQDEGMLFGMLVTHLILDALGDSLVEDGDLYILDFEKFEKTLPKTPVVEPMYERKKEIVKAVEKLNKTYKYEFDEKTINKIAESLYPFCSAFKTAFEVIARIPSFLFKKKYGGIPFKFSQAAEFWPFPYLSACGAVLKVVWPEIWENYKFLCFIKEEKRFLTTRCFFGPNLPSKRGSYVSGQPITKKYKDDLIMRDLPYIRKNKLNYYIVPDDYHKPHLFDCEVDTLFKTIRKEELQTKTKIMMNGLVIADFQGYHKSFESYVEFGIPNVTPYDIAQSSKKTLVIHSTRSRTKVKYLPHVLKNANYSKDGWNKILEIEKVMDSRNQKTLNIDLFNFTEEKVSLPIKYLKSPTKEHKSISEGVYYRPYGEGFAVYGEGTKRIKHILKETGGEPHKNPQKGWIYSRANLRKLKVKLMFPSEVYLEGLINELVSRRPNDINYPDDIKEAIYDVLPEMKDNAEFEKNFDSAYKKVKDRFSFKKDYESINVTYKKHGPGYLVTGVGSGPASELGEWREDLQGYYLTPKKFEKVKYALDILG